MATKGALDDSIQAASGIAILQSMVEGEPRYLPTIIADKTTGLMVVQSVLAALFHRERTGEGQSIEVPMFESMVSFVMTEHLWGQSFEPPLDKAGLRATDGLPSQTLQNRGRALPCRIALLG
jgi:crotonobetainyl-CoA:carnitine CoA-transferase CaiB-like acyl-CoA transferase